MQIVIDIPEDVLGFIYLHGFVKQEDRNTVNRAILGCMELPKKHGRLIDVDELSTTINSAVVVDSYGEDDGTRPYYANEWD